MGKGGVREGNKVIYQHGGYTEMFPRERAGRELICQRRWVPGPVAQGAKDVDRITELTRPSRARNLVLFFGRRRATGWNLQKKKGQPFTNHATYPYLFHVEGVLFLMGQWSHDKYPSGQTVDRSPQTPGSHVRISSHSVRSMKWHVSTS